LYDEVLASLRRRLATLRLGDPLDKNTDVGAINSAAQLAKIRELSDIGEGGRAERWSAPCELPVKGFWFPPTVFTGVSQAHRIAREEIFGPGAVRPDVPDARRGAGEGQQHAVRPVGRGLDRERLADPAHGLPAAGRVVWANTFNKFDPTAAVRGLQGIRLRPGRRPAGTGGLPRLSDTAAAPRIAVRKTYKLYIGGTFPRSESGRSYPVTDPQGQVRCQRGAGLAQGRPGRGRGGAQGVRRSGRRPPPTTAARSCTGSPSCSRAAAPSSSPRSGPPRD